MNDWIRSNLWLAVMLSLTITVLLGACSDDSDNGDDNEPQPTEEEVEVEIEEGSPDPIDVSADEVHLVEEWEVHDVPKYEDVEAQDFDQHAGEVENAGTILFVSDDPPEDVVAYFRGALDELDWQERRVSPSRVYAVSESAALTISVTPTESDGSMIMMILTDRY